MQEVLERSIQGVLQTHPFKLEVEQAWTKASTYLYRSIAAIQQLWQVRQVIMCYPMPSLSKLPSSLLLPSLHRCHEPGGFFTSN